jgi:threonylcarbamoyladenosine tRNA methylthiotransferase MtaB
VKYAVITFGCRVNQADSIGFEENLRARGAVAAPPEDADVVVVNTCSVTAAADQGARQTIRRLARDNPRAKVVVTGCYATRRPDEVAALPNVHRVVLNDHKLHLVTNAVADLTTAERFGDGEGACGAAIEPGVAGRTAFTLRVQTGCDEPCSYCIIPTTRGRPRSVAVDAVAAEVDRIAAAGFKEIALTGVHLGSYGRDLAPASTLVDLLRALIERGEQSSGAPRARFRVSSLEPMDCPPALLDLMTRHTSIAPHLHLPLQHASDRLLAAMRRPYTIAKYASLVDLIRWRVPHASIGSDVIVGFPGETDADFQELADYLESSPLTHLHVFPYSDRPGTEAARLGGKVSGAIVRDRARRIREIGRRLSERFRDSQIGTVHQGLTLEDGSLVVTGNYLKLRIPPGRVRNEWVQVRIASHDHGELLGG